MASCFLRDSSVGTNDTYETEFEPERKDFQKQKSNTYMSLRTIFYAYTCLERATGLPTHDATCSTNPASALSECVSDDIMYGREDFWPERHSDTPM
jgi:hypothetical protein